MNPQYLSIIAAVGIVVVVFIFLVIWTSRYLKVGPNQVLIVSGRRRQLADGTWLGFRIVIPKLLD